MFKTIVQKWNSFKADWKEYEKKYNAAEFALRRLERMEHRITGSYDYDDASAVKCCIEAKYLALPSRIALDELLGGGNVKMVESVRYCPHFQHGKSLKKAGPCTDADCPLHKRNVMYAAAAAEYVLAEENRCAAWHKLWHRSK